MSLRDLGLLVVLGAIWGASYLFLRIAAPVIGVLPLIDLRVVIAAAALFLYALALGRRPALRSRWRSLLLLGALNAAVPFTLIAAATLYLNASMASILNATTPLFTAVVAALWMQEPLGWRRLLGLALGLIGVGVLMGWSPIGLSSHVALGVICSLGGALCYGVGGVFTKTRFQGAAALDLALGQQVAAGLLLLPLAVVAWQPQPATPAVWISVLALGLLSTAVGYLIYFDLIARVGPTNTLSVTFLVPLFGTLWGVLFLNEPMRISLFAGLAVILTGVFLVTGAGVAEPSPAAIAQIDTGAPS